MTLVSDIIKYAFRQSNLVAVGTEPTDAEKTEALYYLNVIVSAAVGNEVGDPLTSFPIGRVGISKPSGFPWWDTVPDSNWFVPKNTRVMLNLDQALELYLHPDPDDGTRFALIDVAGSLAAFPLVIHGNGRTFEGQPSITINTAFADSEWLYRADTGNWSKSSPLTLTDEFPFPQDFDDYFIATLSMRLNPSFGVAVESQTIETLRNGKSQLRARYAQSVQVRSELGLIRPTKMAADRDRLGYSTWLYQPNDMFNKGWPW
jgi:hypothetical protein